MNSQNTSNDYLKEKKNNKLLEICDNDIVIVVTVHDRKDLCPQKPTGSFNTHALRRVSIPRSTLAEGKFENE